MPRLLLSTLLLGFLPSCQTDLQTTSLGVLALSGMPGHELEQTYYVGIFDPLEQLPPSFYRIRLHGQASGLSLMRFASGWVPAPVVDSLGSDLTFSDNGLETSGDQLQGFETGRRLVLFGPEGFRTAPKDHRLVVVMGSSPEAFFSAVDSTLGSISKAKLEQLNEAEEAILDQMRTALANEEARLADLAEDIAFSLDS